jgi:hypothetical protein
MIKLVLSVAMLLWVSNMVAGECYWTAEYGDCYGTGTCVFNNATGTTNCQCIRGIYGPGCLACKTGFYPGWPDCSQCEMASQPSFCDWGHHYIKNRSTGMYLNNNFTSINQWDSKHPRVWLEHPKNGVLHKFHQWDMKMANSLQDLRYYLGSVVQKREIGKMMMLDSNESVDWYGAAQGYRAPFMWPYDYSGREQYNHHWYVRPVSGIEPDPNNAYYFQSATNGLVLDGNVNIDHYDYQHPSPFMWPFTLIDGKVPLNHQWIIETIPGYNHLVPYT